MKIALGVLLLACLQPLAGRASDGYFDLDRHAVLETGDTWSIEGRRYRLYGTQSCLRSTTFTNRSGQKQDCGDASLAVLAALIEDTHPSCMPLVIAASITYVACYARVGNQRLDLATMLISEGFAFAALNAEGLPINTAYAVAEQRARAQKKGLWAFPDTRHPSLLLGQASRQMEQAR